MSSQPSISKRLPVAGPDTLRLPHNTVPTNLAGVYSHPPFTVADLRTASAAELLRQGFLIPRPAPDASPAAIRAWDRALSVPWTKENHVVPDLEPQPGRTHLRSPRGRKAEIENATISTNWSGSELGGAWSGVTAVWKIPTVSKPSEHSGPGGWQSSSWVGIGGDIDFNSTDLFQAGITQDVDSGGGTSYYAWYEWIDYFRRVTLNDQTPSTYALAAVSRSKIFIAFRGEQNHLDIMFSTDYANTFGNKLSSNETTSQGPALVLHNNLLLVAWTGHGNNQINIAQVGFSATPLKLTNKVTLPSTSTSGPALASFNGTLYLAWRGAGDRITIAASTDNGATFSQPFAANESTPAAPTLAAHGKSLFIGWKGDGNDFLNVATVSLAGSLPSGIVGKLTITTETTSDGPSLASQNGTLFLAWKNSHDDHLNVMQSTDDGHTFFGKFTSSEESPSGPALCPVADIKLLIGWRGTSDHLDLAAIGVRNNSIAGFGGDPDYFNEVKIKNFDVHPGDTVVCTLLYAKDLSVGTIYFGNVTTGNYLSMSIVPLFQAEMDGGVIEWIMEAPTDNNQQTVIAKFTPVVFTDAIGCSFTGTLGNAANGETVVLVDANGTPMTSVALAPEEVTIDFIG